MRTRRILFPIAAAALAALAGPLAGQDPEIAAAPPAHAPVYRFDVASWEEPMCAGATAWTWEVPAGQWIELPIGWVAVDHPTAIQNWDCMAFEVRLGDRALAVPEGLNWDMTPVSFDCPDRTVEGMALSPLVYLPPVTTARTYTIRYTFRADVDDGWDTYEKGSDLAVRVTLRPAPEPGG